MVSSLMSCTKIVDESNLGYQSKSENNQLCSNIDFSQYNLGEKHNEYVIRLFNGVNEEMSHEDIDFKIMQNYYYLSNKLYEDEVQRNWMDSLSINLIENLKTNQFDLSATNGVVFDSIKLTYAYPYYSKIIFEIENMTDLVSFNSNLDLILSVAALNLNCHNFDAIYGTILVAKSSAFLWSSKEHGGIGFYEEIFGLETEKAVPDWLKRSFKADASSTMTYMMGVGIAGAISSAAIPPSGAIFFGGWALSAGMGSALGAAGI